MLRLAVGGGVDPETLNLAQYGVVGTFCALFVLFAFRAWKRETERNDRLEAELRTVRDDVQDKATWKRETERNDRLEAELRTVRGDVQDKAIPALLASANALAQVTELLRDWQRDQRDRDRHLQG